MCSGVGEVLSLPDLPGGVALKEGFVELLFFFEGVDAGPEAVVLVGVELLFLNEAAEGGFDEFFIRLHVVEDFFFEDEVAAVDADVAATDGADGGDGAVGVGLDDVVGVGWAYGEECGDFSGVGEVLLVLGVGEIGEAVGVVGDEVVFVLEVFAYGVEALAHVGVDAGVDEGDVPVVDV